MAGEYDDILAAAVGDEAPRRTKLGALKYQPADTDWSLDRLGELQTFYEGTFKRSLPITVKGQGTIHNKWGYDHRGSADISLNPSTPEGQALIAELQKRRVPFLAFDKAIPGVATGPHIHVGQPSHRTTAKYNVGAQVKGQRKATPAPDTYDDILAAAVGQEPAKPAGRQPAQPALDPLLHQLGRINDASDPGAPAGMGEFRRAEAAQIRAEQDTGVGRLRQLDEPAMAQRHAIEAQVRQERQAAGSGVPLPRPFARGLDYAIRNPTAAISDVFAGRSEEESVAAEVDRRIQQSYQAQARSREIAQQLTDEDRTQLRLALERMRGKGSVSRGIETGSQRVGSGLLYKLGALADIAGSFDPTSEAFTGGRSEVGDYLRRQAGRGDLAIEQIEAEMPPDLRQQFADFTAHAVGALPEIFGATAVAGPVGGFAALGGLEAAGRKQPFAEVAKETVKGAVLGAVFQGAGAVESLPGRTLAQRAANTAQSGAVIGVGTYAVEKAFGADDYSAARAAASNLLLHGAMRLPGEIAKFTSEAERALKSPTGEPTPTVPADLQARLARAEAGQPTDATPVAVELKDPTTPPADVTSRPVPAEPAADAAAISPAAPSQSGRSEYLESLGLTPEEVQLLTTRPADVPLEQREALKAARKRRTELTRQANESGLTAMVGDVLDTATRQQRKTRPLADAMRERMETGPVEPTRPDLDLVEPSAPGEPWRVLSRQGDGSLRTEQFRTETEAIDRMAELAADSAILTKGEPVDLGEVDAGPAKSGAVNLITGKPVKGGPKGEGGFISVTEIARGIRKLRDMRTSDDQRAVRYALRLPTGRELGVNLTIDKDGVAFTQVRPLERQGRELVLGKEKLDVGVETLLGLKRYLLQAHPEITRFKFRDEGGELATLTPVRRSTPEPIREVDLDAVRQKLAGTGLEVREATSPIPTFTVVNAVGREVAKFANRDRAVAAKNLAHYAGIGRPKTVAPDFETRQRLNRTELDELAAKNFDPDSLAYYNRTDPIRLKRLYTDVVVRGKKASATDLQDIGAGKPPKSEGGFLNIGDIAVAVRELMDEFGLTEKEARDRLEDERPYLFVPGVSRAEERELRQQEFVDRVRTPEGDPEKRYQQITTALLQDFPNMSNQEVAAWMYKNHPDLVWNRFGIQTQPIDADALQQSAPGRLAETFARQRVAETLPPKQTESMFERHSTYQPLETIKSELKRRFPRLTDDQLYTAARRRQDRQAELGALDLTEKGVDVGPTKPPRNQGGYVDLNEIREGLAAGKLKIEEAIERARKRFPNSPEEKVRAILARDKDPLIGIVDEGSVSAFDNPYRAMTHSIVFRESLRQRPNADRWRYEPRTQKVYWDEWNDSRMPSLVRPFAEQRVAVEDYLAQKGLTVTYHGPLSDLNHKQLWDADIEAAAKPPVHHSTVQPRTNTGQFAPGEPGGLEAARSQLRSEARKYATEYKRLDLHQARREGLDIVNDDVARNYFGQLHRMAAEFLPAQAEAVDRAESLYNQGKYGQAAMLAESVFRSLPDKVNEYSSADAAIQLAEKGIPSKSDWSKVLQEVRERLKRTGGLSGGGSTFYDVNKYPEGGRPDHAKIAYILEPVIDALKADANRLIAEGKLKATDYVAHVRKAVNEMLAREEFSDWHPLNKSAALGVLVDRLRQEGPPPTPSAEPPAQRLRSLPPTLERSGRDPGTNLTYDRLPNATVNSRVEARLAAEGPEALETWYRNAPESADRTAAHRVLVDHYTAHAIELADTAPQRAEALLAHARELSNLEAGRATTIGQAMQMYSNLLRYTPSGVLREVSRMEAQGTRVTPEQTRQLVEAAHQAERTDREVHRLERQLTEAEATEAPEPVEVAAAPTPTNAATRRAQRSRRPSASEPEGGGSGGDGPRPRRYRPRAGAPDTPAERIRRQLDEAAQRRRAQRLAIAAQLRQIEQQRTAAGYWKRAMNLTRGLMVSAFSTAMRNLQSQALRFDVERLDDLVEHSLRRSTGLDSDFTYRNIWRNTARQFRFTQTAEAREILAAHEGEYHRMFNTYAGGVDVPIPTRARGALERLFQTAERGVEIANFANRVQEFHLRSAEFLAELDLHLRNEHNQTLEQYVRRNGIDAIPLELVRRATDKALEVTFAAAPGRDGAGGRLLNSLIELGNYIPPTISPVAFPRFMFNNLKFLYQHSPAGMLDLARRGQNRPRIIARSLVGTSMLLLAYQFRKSDHAGEKWYELKFGNTTVDARPFGPFSTYLFIAEAIRRAKEGEKQFTLDEVAQAAGASVLGTGVGFALVEKLYNQISSGDWEKLQRTMKQEGGEWGRALLTPVRQVKDLIGAFDASQAINRDTTESPFLGPIQESIPYADSNLPPAQLPTTATPLHQERPAAKATTGWRVITPKTFIQRQLDELNFTNTEILPSTGNPTLDTLQKRIMGPLMDQLSDELERDAEYKSLSKKARAAFLQDLLKDIREEVRDAAEAEQPELYEQHQEERKPRRQREYEQELNSPGLSRALQLGVPMPIPPRQPGEDDIAYRARLLQVGRQRRARLDQVAGQLGNLPVAGQRSRLHEALYGG